MKLYEFTSTPLYAEFIKNLPMKVKTPPSSDFTNDWALKTGVQYYGRLISAGYQPRFAANLAYWRGILAVQETPAGDYKEELEDLLQLKLM